MPNALVDTIAKADCGATGTIKAGESSVLIRTRVEVSSTNCVGCFFSLRMDLSPCLDATNTNKHRLCVEDDAPIAR